jgi:CBS domain-containing protein
MTHDVITTTPENTLYEAARIMGQKHIGSLIVLMYETPVGIITERNLLNTVSSGVEMEKDWIGGYPSIREIKIAKAMTCPAPKICLDSSIKKAARIMLEKKVRHFAVCDSGQLKGIISSSDLIRSLPEIPETMKVWFDIDYFMSKHVITADRETLVEQVAKIMAAKHVGSVIITKKEEPIGIFTERDLLTKFLAKDKSLIEEVGEVCSSPLVTAPIGISVQDAAIIMAAKHIRRLPITKDHKLVGILTAGDLVEAYARE